MDVLVEARLGEVAAEHGGEQGVGFVGCDRCAGTGQHQGVAAEPGAELEDGAERGESAGAMGGGGGRGGLLERGGGVPAGRIGAELAPGSRLAGDQVDGQRDHVGRPGGAKSLDGGGEARAAQVGGGETGEEFLATVAGKQVQCFFMLGVGQCRPPPGGTGNIATYNGPWQGFGEKLERNGPGR